jgi:hypothetical protein
MSEQTCKQCGGLIMEQGKCYGYAGKVCQCMNQSYFYKQGYIPSTPDTNAKQVDVFTEAREQMLDGWGESDTSAKHVDVDVERVAKIAYYARDPTIKMPAPVPWEENDDEFHKDYFRRIASAVIASKSTQSSDTSAVELAAQAMYEAEPESDGIARYSGDKKVSPDLPWQRLSPLSRGKWIRRAEYAVSAITKAEQWLKKQGA